MISREVDYAIRIIIGVASGGGRLVPASDVSEKMNVPYRFLRKISLALVKDGILQSRRGSGGGLLLARPADQISLLDVVSSLSAKGTGINLCLRADGKCDLSSQCKLHPKLKRIQGMLDDEFARIKFSDLVDVAAE